MAAAKGTPSVSGDRNPLRMVLFILSIGLCFLCFYLILDFQGSAQSKLSGELILGQVDSASYNHKDAPILGFFFEYFGVLTYLFAAMIVYLGYFLVLKPIDIWHADFYKACLRLLGFNCTLIGLSGILSRYFDIGFTGAGGLLGDMLNMFCDLALPSILSVFIFAITVFCGLSMLWGRNPFFIFDRVGDLFFKVLPAKSNTNGKKHNTHHSLAQDDNDLTLDQNTLGAAALATGVMASATASAKEQDMAPDMSQDMSQDMAQGMALEQNGSLPNADELNVASEDKVLPDLESLAQQQLSADNNMSPIAAADSHGMETNGSQEAQDGFFAQVMNSEYGRMSPNDQSAVNNEPYQALEQDNQVLAQDLEQTQSPVQNQAQGYEMGQEMSQGQGQVQGQSQVQGLGEVPQQAMAQDNEQGYYENNEELINSAAQNVAPYSESYAEPSSELNNNLGTAIDPNESFINSNNQAAVQLFANEMQSEEDNSFNNALAGLEPQEDLSQVPPMPNLNNTQESTPEPGQDFFAFANEQNNMQNQAMQDELYPLPDQTQSSGMAQAQGLGQAQATAQAQAAAQTAAQAPASVPAIESDQVFISNAAIDDIGTLPPLEQNLDLANTKVESGVDFNAEVAPNQFASNMNGSYQQGSFDQGTDIPVSNFKDAQMPMNNEQVELPQQDMGQGSYANELVPEATLESAPIQSQDDALAYTQAREQALEPASAPATAPANNNLATENSLPQDSDLGNEGASDNGPSTLISSGASVAQADAIAATAATADAVPVAAANASTVNGVVAAMAAEGTGVTAAAGVIASAVGGLAAKEALADVAATAATAVSAASATASNTVKDGNKEKGEPDSPYGYGSYAAKHALVPSVALEDSNNESDDGSDSEAVHTIVQRTDPKVIAAQIAAQNKEKEERERKRREEQERKEQAERERKEQEAAQRKAQELQEAQAKAEAEAKARAEAEAEAQAQAQAMAQSHEQESGTSANASAGDNATDGLPQSDDDQYEYVYEEDDEAPIYAGTYAARLAREKAAQNGQPLNKRRLKKINRDTGEEVIDLAEPNTHDIGVDLPLEERPRTIIRDSRNDAEDISSKTNNYYPSAKNTNNSVPEHNNAEQASSLSEQVADSSNQDQPSDSLNGASNDDSEGPHLSSQLSNSVSDGQEAPKNELIETLSNLASEMDDAKLQHFNEHQDLGMANSDEQSFNFDKLEQGANTHANASANTNTNAYDNAEVNNTEDDIVSTNIQMGSGSPVPESQKFNQGNISTNITRSNAATDASLDNDSDFFRFATTRDNELQAKNSEQNNASNAVDVNLFDDDYDKPYVPKHVYDFGGKEVGHIDESLSGTEGGSDDEFVTGAAVEDKTLPGQGGFDFARFVTSSEENSESNSTSVSTSASDESKDLSQEQEDNIISFNKFDEPKKSYEVGSLSSAFIPMEDEGHDSQVSKGNSLFGDYDYVHDSYENKVKEQQLKQELKAEAEAEDKAETEAGAQVKSEIATYEDAQLSENNAEDYQEDDQNEQYQDDEEYQEGQYSDGQFPVGANGFDQGMMANQMEAFNNAQMMNNQAMYNPMANQMPNGQQVQYMQLPNGQYVPVMPNAMNNMAPNMMYPNMANPNMPMGQVQYMQLPNGQYVPVMPNAMNNMAPNMMYQNMAANNMAMAGAMPNMPMANNQQANMLPGNYEPANTNDSQLHLQDNMPGNGFVSGQVEASDAHSMGEHGPSGVGLPTAGNAFMGAHNSSSSNLPSYMAGVSQGAGAGAARTERSSLALCSVPRHRYDSWRPSLDLLARSNSHVDISLDELNKTSERINDVLHSFGIKATVADYLTGPVITRFDLDLAPGVKSTAISSIETELCRNLMVPNVRVVPIVEGSSYVGLEVPNPQRQFITLADMASSREFQESKASLPMCLGASVVGAPVVKDLAECPHLLVAGTTGSGKSAGLNTMLISLLLKRSPSELRLILVDPKQLEFSIYKDLPHLITPVITDVAEKTPIALRWCVDEMERRFKLMSMLGVRKLSEYNDLIKSKAANGQSVADPLWNKDVSPQPQALEPLPWIVVVVEEFADLMAQSGRKKDKESTPDGLIARLSAKSRAAGIHLVLVTQTPRSEVVTGMIKANFPSRVAFTVQNRLDSTIVLDEKGAECLLGNGDMLYKFPGEGTATRAHGSFTSNDDVKAVVDAWKEYAGAPEYLEDVVAVQEEETEDPAENKAKELDVKFDQAVEVVREYMDRRNKPPTVTDLQTELGVGYPRAKKIFMQLSREGIID